MLLFSFSVNLSRMSFAIPEQPRVFVDPPTVRTVINATFSINVSIAEITGLYCYDFRLRYDNTTLNCTHAEIPPGHFLDSPNTFKIKDGEIHQDDGYVVFAAMLFGEEESKNGSGVLGTITFKVLRKGECLLELYEVTLFEPEGMIPSEEYDVYHGCFSTFSKIYVDPQTSKAAVNKSFSINITISDIVNLWEYDFRLRYDNTTLNCTHAEIPPGHFLDSLNTSIIKDGEIHQDEGWVWFSATLLTPEKPKNGSGVLGTITFKVLERGECPLELCNVTLVESNGEKKEIPPEEYDVYNGYFMTPSRVYVDPPTIRAVVGTTFSINITISDITDLAAYELGLKYNNTILNCTHAEIPPGHFLDTANNTFKIEKIHQDDGYVVFAALLLGEEEPKNGSGVLGTITFKVLQKGQCPLELYGVILIRPDGVIPPEEYDVGHGYLVTSLSGDLNGDGIINMIDLNIVARAFHSAPGDPRWNPLADIDEPYGWIDIIDLWVVAKSYGKEA